VSKEAGQSFYPNPNRPGRVRWEDGEVFRSGKTARERDSGQQVNYLRNREERREENRRKAGKKP